jgi:maltooligosyltrehalose trehalohydrolase
MTSRERGYFEISVPSAQPGDRYGFTLKTRHGQSIQLPDPASRSQPDGVHGLSEIVDSRFDWTEGEWKGLALEELVIYELHVGAFSARGDFQGVRERLRHIRDLGANAVEIMPVAQFPGRRNWGYDGVGLFAVQNSYGGPQALKSLVDDCHALGLAVILDVVYNHLGPEGNYLAQFGPYFQDKYKTPWGEALNYDGEWSDEVRRYFLENARQWLEEFHFDGLRLDAVHAIFDSSAKPFLEDLSELKAGLEDVTGRKLHLIAESDANDSRLLRARSEGGIGMDAQWSDDLHHCIHALLTGESRGYYADYGKVSQLAGAFAHGVIFEGIYSEVRHRSHGRPYEGIDRNRLVVCSQNHDQVGNRMMGERLLCLVGQRKQRLAAACVFLSPYLPLIFMGEEFGETAPFLYFVDHTDPELLEAVRRGRKAEFSGFDWQGEPPDPANADTFERSRLSWRLSTSADGKNLIATYRRLAELSRWIRRHRIFESPEVEADGSVVKVRGLVQQDGSSSGRPLELQVFLSFSSETRQVWMDASNGPLEIVFDSWEDDGLSENPETIGEGRAEIALRPFQALALRRS